MRKAIGMENKFNLGIEISEKVSKTAVPKKIKRYDVVRAREIKKERPEQFKFYRYRPGVNSFITRDLDV